MNPADTPETHPGVLPAEIEADFLRKPWRHHAVPFLPGYGIKGLTNHLRTLVGRRFKRG